MAISNPSINLSSELPIPNVTTPANQPPTNDPGQPALHHRPVGQHAALHGFNWDKPADYHKYLVKTGLPEVHAAVLNGDWAYAKEILCAEDIGLRWLPAISQHQASKQSVDQETPHWAMTIASRDQSKQARAIIDMAINLSDITSVKPAGCLYGTNLLTLCLQLPAPADFTQKVIDLAKQQAPAHLTLPDGSGRTPVYIAIDRQDAAALRALLEAGANPFQKCTFAEELTPSVFEMAMKKDYDEFFSILLEKTISLFTTNGEYSAWDDDLFLQKWVAQHDESAIRKMADQFPVLRDVLFNNLDESGTSLVYRHLKRGEVANLFDVTILPILDYRLEKNALYASALGSPVKVFCDLVEKSSSQFKKNKTIQRLIDQTLNEFFINRSTTEIKELLEVPGKIGQKSHAALMASIKNGANYPTEKLIAITKLLWPKLDDTEKNDLLVTMTKYPEACFHAVLDMMDCSLTEEHITTMLTNARDDKHKAAWEFAADRSPYIGQLLNIVREKNFKPFFNVKQAVDVGSLRWFDKFVDAGFDLQEYIRLGARDFLPRLADLDPAGLQKRLTGYKLPTDDTILASCKTEQGRQALSELMKSNLALQ